MKIDEFTNKLGDLVNFTCSGRFVHIYANEWQLDHDESFLELDLKLDNLIYFEDWEQCKRLAFDRLCEVLNLVHKLRYTPVEERFPEKKYRLRWFKDSNGAINSLDYGDGEWSCGDIHYAKQYSQQELEKLKEENPKLAPAIDAMKEPAEE